MSVQTEIISTHAPAGGATGELANAYKYLRISTHAPAGGATHTPSAISMAFVFLLTPLREGRPARRCQASAIQAFLLTPLREGRRSRS